MTEREKKIYDYARCAFNYSMKLADIFDFFDISYFYNVLDFLDAIMREVNQEYRKVSHEIGVYPCEPFYTDDEIAEYCKKHLLSEKGE